MSKSLQIFFFFFLVTQICFAQWVQTNFPANVGIDALTAWGGNLFAGTSVGVFHSSNNGDAWNEVNNGLTSSGVSSFAVIGVNLFAGVGRGGVFLSTNLGASWTAVQNGLTQTVFALTVSATNLYAGSTGGVFLTTNNGTSWTNIGLTQNYICALATSGENIFAGTTEAGIFLSTNRGSSWTSVNNGLTNTFVEVLAVSGENIFAGTEGGGIFLSTNQGANWTAVNNGLTGFVYDLAVSGENIFAGTSDGVFHTTNNGIVWNEINSGLISNEVTALAVSSENIFAGTAGVWRRPLYELIPVELNTFTATANGKEVALNWSTATELNNQGFEVQRKFGSNEFVTVGSVKGHGTTTSPNNYTYIDKLTDAGKYFYRLKQIDFGGKYEYSQTVEVNWSPFTTYKLEQNYPNPFNPTTTIGFGIPASPNPSEGGALVTLKVFDILGNEVKTLVNKEMEAGYHSVEFDASGIPSGVYFYQLRATPSGGQAGSFVETRKMVLLR